MSKFWRALWKKLGTETQDEYHISTANGGQTERANLVLQEYLSNYVSADHQDWVDHIGMAEFSYNSAKHMGTGMNPFLLVYGNEPLTPTTLALDGATKASKNGTEVVEIELFLKERARILELARPMLTRARRRYETKANLGKRQVSF